MKKIYTTIIFLLCTIVSFANFNDNLNLLKEEEKKAVEEKISEISKEKKLTIFVNTLPMDEGFAISDPELAVILNLKKVENDKKFEVELSFSKDIDIEDYKKDVDDALAGTEDLLKQGEYGKYLIATLEGIEAVLSNIEIEPLEQMNLTMEQEESGKNLYPIIILTFVIFIIGRVIYKYRKRKLARENLEKRIRNQKNFKRK